MNILNTHSLENEYDQFLYTLELNKNKPKFFFKRKSFLERKEVLNEFKYQ